MLLDQDDKEEHGGHNNGQAFQIEKLLNLTRSEERRVGKEC